MSKSILIVHDDGAMDGLEDALRRVGLSPQFLSNAEELEMWLSGSSAGGVLIPGAVPDGARWVERVRRHGPALPVLFLGRAAPEDPIRSPSDALAIGADYFFKLPTDLDYLAGRVENWTQQTPEPEVVPGPVRSGGEWTLEALAEPSSAGRDEPESVAVLRGDASQDLERQGGWEWVSELSDGEGWTGLHDTQTDFGPPSLEPTSLSEDLGVPPVPQPAESHSTLGSSPADPNPGTAPSAAAATAKPTRPEEPGGEALVRDARSLWTAGQPDEALDALEMAIALFRADGRVESALHAHQLAVQWDPTQVEHAQHGADLALELGKRSEAVELLHASVEGLEAAGRGTAADELKQRLAHLRPAGPPRSATSEPARASVQPESPDRASATDGRFDELETAIEAALWESLPPLSHQPDPQAGSTRPEPDPRPKSTSEDAWSGSHESAPADPETLAPPEVSSPRAEPPASKTPATTPRNIPASPSPGPNALGLPPLEAILRPARGGPDGVPGAFGEPPDPGRPAPAKGAPAPSRSGEAAGSFDDWLQTMGREVGWSRPATAPPSASPSPPARNEVSAAPAAPVGPVSGFAGRVPGPSVSPQPEKQRVQSLGQAVRLLTGLRQRRWTGSLRYKPGAALVWSRGEIRAVRGPEPAAEAAWRLGVTRPPAEDALRPALRAERPAREVDGVLAELTAEVLAGCVTHRGDVWLEPLRPPLHPDESLPDLDPGERVVEALIDGVGLPGLVEAVGGFPAHLQVGDQAPEPKRPRERVFRDHLDGRTVEEARRVAGIGLDRAFAWAAFWLLAGHGAVVSVGSSPDQPPEPSGPPTFQERPPVDRADAQGALAVPHRSLTGLPPAQRVRQLAHLARTGDYFRLLDVTADADPETVARSAAFLTQVMEGAMDSDEPGVRALAEEVVRTLDEASQVLQDPTLRQAYRTHLVRRP